MDVAVQGFHLTPNSDAAKSSKQIKDPFQRLYDDGLALLPPCDPDTWASLMSVSTRYGSLVRTYARNVAGQGWRIVPTVELSRKTPEDLKQIVETDIRKCQDFYGHPHSAKQSKRFQEESFSELLVKQEMDRQATGNGYLETARGLNGFPGGLWHVPGTTMRLLSNLEGFVQYSAGHTEWVYFKNFGDPRIMDWRDGQFVSKRRLKAFKTEFQANEVIHFQLYSPASTHYGLPRVVAAELAIVGSRAAARRNYAFFTNDAVPRMAVIVSGGSLSNKSIEQIEAMMAAESRGDALAHRVLLLHATPGQQTQSSPPKIELQPLTVGMQDDASFTKYSDSNASEIREAFNLSELHLGSDKGSNRAAALTLLRLVNEQEFKPTIHELEYRLNATVTSALGSKMAMLELRRPTAMDPIDESKIFSKLIPAGAVTPKDMRLWLEKSLGFDMAPYTEAWTEYPYSMIMALLRSGQILPSNVGDSAALSESLGATLDDLKGVQKAVEDAVEDLKEEMETVIENAVNRNA